MTKKEKFSVSRVNLYLENPWKHWCKYIKKLKPIVNREDTKYMDRGTVFHSVLEGIAKGKSVEEAKAFALVSAHEKGFVQEAKDTGILAFERYANEYNPDWSKFADSILHTEYELNYDLSDSAVFNGFIDAIMDNGDGTVTLVDYKTYSKAPQADKMKYSLQAHMYMYVATQLGFDVKGFMFDCVNPTPVLKGRAYKTKRIEFLYNDALSGLMFENFCRMVEMIQANPEFNLYIPGDYKPDILDYLFKVYTGEVSEDLETFLEEYFEE